MQSHDWLAADRVASAIGVFSIEAKEPWPGPMCAGDLARDDRERSVALTAPFDAIGEDNDRVRDPMPFAHETRPRLERRSWSALLGRQRFCGSGGLQLAENGFRQAAECVLLHLVADPAHQDIPAQSLRRRRLMKTPPFFAQTIEREILEPNDLCRDVEGWLGHVSCLDASR